MRHPTNPSRRAMRLRGPHRRAYGPTLRSSCSWSGAGLPLIPSPPSSPFSTGESSVYPQDPSSPTSLPRLMASSLWDRNTPNRDRRSAAATRAIALSWDCFVPVLMRC